MVSKPSLFSKAGIRQPLAEMYGFGEGPIIKQQTGAFSYMATGQ